MTIGSSNNRSGPYTCNGVTTAFPSTFKIYDETHVQVIHADADGVETVLTLTTDYTVSGVGSDTFTVTIAPALDEGTITLLLNVPFTQGTDLENQGAFNAETIERALDLATQRELQILEKVNRSVQSPASSGTTPETLASYIEALGAISAELGALGQITVAIEGVAAIDTEVAGVYAIRLDVSAVAAVAANVTTVAGVAANVTTVAGVATEIAALAPIAASIAAVAGVDAEVAALAAITAAISSVDGIKTSVSAVALISADVSTVAGISADVSTVAGISADIQTLAALAPDIGAAVPVENQINAATDTAFDDADHLVARKAADGSLIKRTWANVKAALKTYFDTLYQPLHAILTSLAGLAITTGDLVYGSAANTLSRRAIGSTGDVLTVSGGLPVWAAPASSGQSPPTSSALPVGFWGTMRVTDSTSIANGNTITGTKLCPVGGLTTNLSMAGAAQSGTWKNIEGATVGGGNDIGLFVRTA